MFSVEGFGFRDALLLRMWPWSRPEDAEGLKGESWTCWDEKHSVNPTYTAQKTYLFEGSYGFSTYIYGSKNLPFYKFLI